MCAWLPDGGTLLELGMGPGKDLDLLAEHYRVTGSDFSNAFLDRYREKHPDADLVNLDALTIETDRSFDGIFSNKVLVHMSDEDLDASFARQAEVLNPGGVILHSFWYGEGEEQFGGLTLRRRDEAALKRLVEPHLELFDAGTARQDEGRRFDLRRGAEAARVRRPSYPDLVYSIIAYPTRVIRLEAIRPDGAAVFNLTAMLCGLNSGGNRVCQFCIPAAAR